MAEKGERICVCIENERYKTFDRAVWQTLKYMTRQEAINRMAKALYIHQYQNMPPRWEDDDNGYREIYLKRAEAALNALLDTNLK